MKRRITELLNWYLQYGMVQGNSFIDMGRRHMLPVFIMAIEDDSDRQFAAELYHSYHSIMHQKALAIDHPRKVERWDEEQECWRT